MPINLISDTVTKPTQGMLEAMLQASVGDDVFKADPTVNMLEQKLAELFGMEAALFFPSGTMANQTAIKLHTQPGDQLICDKTAHVFNYEGGGVSFNSGVSCKLLEGNRGIFEADQVRAAINPPDFYHSPKTSLVCVENTTNKGGGACWDLVQLESIKAVCESHQLRYHLDGARLWNAMVATGLKPQQLGSLFDTISVCFSKGLGCPIGSVLLGNQETVDRALRIRKIFGGGMRQVGYLAAAALYALDHHIDRLAEDHRKASEISKLLDQHPSVAHVAETQTNIVVFKLVDDMDLADAFKKQLEDAQIQIIDMGGGLLRMVTHLDYTDDMHAVVLQVLSNS